MKRCLSWPGSSRRWRAVSAGSGLSLSRWASNVLVEPCAEVNPWVQHCFAWLDELVAGRFNMTMLFQVDYTTVFGTSLVDNGVLESWKHTHYVIQASKTVS